MMKNYSLLGIIMILLIAAACNKDEAEPLPEPPENYQPITQGSFWTYSGYNGGQSYNVEVTGQTDTIDGNLYFGLNHTLLGEVWFRKENGTYVNLYEINGEKYEFPYLQDNKDTGVSWEFEATIGGIKTLQVYTIRERDTSKVVFGQLFKNVIVVEMSTYLDLGVGYDSAYFTSKNWYANDIGLIFSDISDEGLTFLEFFEIK